MKLASFHGFTNSNNGKNNNKSIYSLTFLSLLFFSVLLQECFLAVSASSGEMTFGKRLQSNLVAELGKRPKQLYSFGIGKRSISDQEMKEFMAEQEQEKHELEQGQANIKRSTMQEIEEEGIQHHDFTNDKRDPYAFGLGKRDPYAFGLGKRDPYAFGLGKRDPYAFGLGKRDPYAFGLGKRDPYAFGLGKRDPYAFGLGKRDPYAFGLGKRDPYAFGLGKRDPYGFGLGKRKPYSMGLGR